MLGSISKVRPCGHHHYYKYAHAETRPDLIAVARNDKYTNDQIEQEWGPFALNNLKSTHVGGAVGTFGNSKMKKWSGYCPNVTNLSFMFWTTSSLDKDGIVEGSTNLKTVVLEGVDWDKVTSCREAFCGSILSSMPEIFAPNPDCDCYGVFVHATQYLNDGNNGVLPFNSYLNAVKSMQRCFVYMYHMITGNRTFTLDERYTFHNLENGNQLFYNQWPYGYTGIMALSPNLSLKNLVDGSLMFNGGRLTSFQTVDMMNNLTNASHMFGGCPIKTLYPDYDSFTLNSLTSASGLFSLQQTKNCPSELDKASIIKLCNALPTYTDGGNYSISYIGIHIDHKYDPDVNLALKKVDMDYVTPIEEVGGTLPEIVTSDKGWAMSNIIWNGKPTENEIINPIFIERDISLPTGYTRCEYLEDTGTQWIDTGYVPQVTTSTDGEGNTIYTATTGLYAIAKQITLAGHVRFFSSGIDAANGFSAPTWMKSTGYHCGFVWKTVTAYGLIGDGSAFESKLNFLQSGTANLVTNYGKSYSNTLNANLGFSPTLSLYLFSTNVNNTSPSNRRWNGRIYHAKISEGTEIVRDFVPCLDANGVPCMYDVLESNGSVEADTYYNANPDSTFLYKLLES